MQELKCENWPIKKSNRAIGPQNASCALLVLPVLLLEYSKYIFLFKVLQYKKRYGELESRLQTADQECSHSKSAVR